MEKSLIAIIQELFNLEFEKGPFIVWYDESGHLKDLLEKNLPKDANFIEYKGSFLGIRNDIESTKDFFAKKWIIYVSQKPIDPSWLRQYEILGQKLELDLSQLIEKAGLKVSQKVREILTTPNGKYILNNWEEVIENYPKPTSKAIIEILLAKVLETGLRLDLKAGILHLINTPVRICESIQQENLMETFCAKLKEKGKKIHYEDPHDIAFELSSSIILAQLSKFNVPDLLEPFQNLIPGKKSISFWQGVYETWKTNTELLPKLIQFVKQFEDKYDILGKLDSLSLEVLMKIDIFPHFEDYLAERIKVSIPFFGNVPTSKRK